MTRTEQSFLRVRSAPATRTRGPQPAPFEGVVEREAKLRSHLTGGYAAFYAYRRGRADDFGDAEG